jgi:hypothetical protein
MESGGRSGSKIGKKFFDRRERGHEEEIRKD